MPNAAAPAPRNKNLLSLKVFPSSRLIEIKPAVAIAAVA
jgi:hypothetical protein